MHLVLDMGCSEGLRVSYMYLIDEEEECDFDMFSFLLLEMCS